MNDDSRRSQSQNPLFGGQFHHASDPGKKPDDDDGSDIKLGPPYGSSVHLGKSKKVIQPLPGQTGREETSKPPIVENTTPNSDDSDGNGSALEMLRHKIDAIYGSEPNAKEEIEEIEEIEHTPGAKLSKHQRYLQKLSTSGKSLADIQAGWHEYYASLSDDEKHEVWQEFYKQNSKTAGKVHQPAKPAHHPQDEHRLPTVAHHKPKVVEPQKLPAKPVPAHNPEPEPKPIPKPHSAPKQDQRSVKEVKEQLLSNVQHRAKTKKKKGSHLKSLAFGLASGSVVVLIMLFGFFNERIIAPFITPSKSVSSTPIIVDPNSTKVGPEPMIIIPKINVEIPVVYDQPSIEEQAIQSALEKGVVHYATTTKPGEIGNGVIFGHSSNNILNKGNYKFAFVLLSKLEKGDTFMLHKGGKRYVYKVFEKKVVPPTDLSVLGKTARPATFSLITCDPPGTTINRLVVVGEQISPDPKANVASTAPKQPARSAQLEQLPSDAPTLWDRLFGWISG